MRTQQTLSQIKKPSKEQIQREMDKILNEQLEKNRLSKFGLDRLAFANLEKKFRK